MFFRRLAQLILGLALYGFATALTVRSDLGLSPWGVFHQGLASRANLSFGTAVNVTGFGLLLIWKPLGQRIGIGTLLNALLIGAAADLSLAFLPTLHDIAARWLILLAGILLTGVATGVYIGAGLEPGPRDGLMTGIVRRTGWSVRAARTGIELSVLAIGALLGGTVGVGTIIYAVGIGPIAQFFLRQFGWRSAPTPTRQVLDSDALSRSAAKSR